MKAREVVVLFAVLLGVALPVHAERLPKEGPQDPRIRTIVYNPRDVVRIDGTYGYHTVVELAEDEQIQGMVIGDSVAWEAEKNAAGNRIFLKPKEDNAATNLTVLTNRRTYSFALQASRATSKDRMTWRLRFEYPEEEAERALAVEERASLARTAFVNPDAPTNPGKWNFDYSYGGGKKFVPVQLFDDGQFTYFKFKGIEELPAIFVVDEEKNESLVNSRVSGEYIVVHRIAKQFALRSGKTVTCIFNEHFDLKTARRLNAPRPVQEQPTASVEPAAAVQVRK